ncbi:MAG: NUDIX hydrolase [Lachnospiraceae bacterium]|nr:NUDIX hydrolase [Lachnospiraceae bacterium]
MTEEEMNSTNWSQSVGGVCIRDGKVLLGRHTYGSGNGKLIIPGGYVKFGETPEEALIREFEEETGVTVHPEKLVGIRFNTKDWYAVFKVSYVEGEARSDGDENSEVIWMNVDEALKDETVPGLTKTMIERTLTGGGFDIMPYQTTKPGSHLYSC